MTRGGKRPGAGAPKGNLNALKHGRYSQQFAKIGALLAADPKVRAALLDVGDRMQTKQRSATEIAVGLLANTFDRGHKQSAQPASRRDGLNPKPPSRESDSINAISMLLGHRGVARMLEEAIDEEEKYFSEEFNQ